MNRFFTKLNKLKICLLLFTSLLAFESYGQQAGCNVILTSIRDTIACGESIDLEDAIDIRDIKNVKLANQVLKRRRKKKGRE